jgi:hypothetical protein
MITLLPAAENNLAISNPMPAVPPLINTVLFVVFILFVILFCLMS